MPRLALRLPLRLPRLAVRRARWHLLLAGLWCWLDISRLGLGLPVPLTALLRIRLLGRLVGLSALRRLKALRRLAERVGTLPIWLLLIGGLRIPVRLGDLLREGLG